MTNRLNMDEIERLSREKTVRGEVVRTALQRMEQASQEDREVIEEALQQLLERFAGEEGASL